MNPERCLDGGLRTADAVGIIVINVVAALEFPSPSPEQDILVQYLKSWHFALGL